MILLRKNCTWRHLIFVPAANWSCGLSRIEALHLRFRLNSCGFITY